MITMTNAELAKYYGELPPDEKASIAVKDRDSGTIECYPVDVLEIEDFENLDGMGQGMPSVTAYSR